MRAIYPKPQLINNVVNYIVIVDFENPADLIVRPEMTAHVTFAPNEKRRPGDDRSAECLEDL